MRFLIPLLMLALAACNSEVLRDGYQPGDGLTLAVDSLAKLDAAVTRYCRTAPGDPARNAALIAIRARYPLMPENGICTLQPVTAGE